MQRCKRKVATISPIGGKKNSKIRRKAQRKLFQCVTRKKPKFVYETQAIQNLIREPEISSSEEERKVNALASGADEGRD